MPIRFLFLLMFVFMSLSAGAAALSTGAPTSTYLYTFEGVVTYRDDGWGGLPPGLVPPDIGDMVSYTVFLDFSRQGTETRWGKTKVMTGTFHADYRWGDAVKSKVRGLDESNFGNVTGFLQVGSVLEFKGVGDPRNWTIGTAVELLNWWQPDSNRSGQIRADLVLVDHTAVLPPVVPEPSTWMLMLAGLGMVVHLRRRVRYVHGKLSVRI